MLFKEQPFSHRDIEIKMKLGFPCVYMYVNEFGLIFGKQPNVPLHSFEFKDSLLSSKGLSLIALSTFPYKIFKALFFHSNYKTAGKTTLDLK
jgi:hypothetical protein